MIKGLLVEDDLDIARLLVEDLADANLLLDHVQDGEAGLAAALSGEYQFVLLDWMVPKLDGAEVCRELRRANSTIPILLLTAKNRTLDKVLLLELGADDYITKPFDLDEVRARIKAVLRRVTAPSVDKKSMQVLVRKDLEIDLVKRRILRNGEPVELTSREFDIVALLAQNIGTPISKESICESVDGSVPAGYERALNSTINRIRMRLEVDPKNPQWIKTAHGFGYLFSEDE